MISVRELIIERPLAFLKKQRIFRDRLLRWFLALALATMLVTVVLLLVRVRPSDFVVPLGYISGVGLASPGQWYHIYGYGLFSLLVTVVNCVLAMAVLERSRISSFFLVTGTVIVNIFTFIITFTLLSQIY